MVIFFKKISSYKALFPSKFWNISDELNFCDSKQKMAPLSQFQREYKVSCNCFVNLFYLLCLVLNYLLQNVTLLWLELKYTALKYVTSKVQIFLQRYCLIRSIATTHWLFLFALVETLEMSWKFFKKFRSGLRLASFEVL